MITTDDYRSSVLWLSHVVCLGMSKFKKRHLSPQSVALLNIPLFGYRCVIKYYVFLRKRYPSIQRVFLPLLSARPGSPPIGIVLYWYTSIYLYLFSLLRTLPPPQTFLTIQLMIDHTAKTFARRYLRAQTTIVRHSSPFAVLFKLLQTCFNNMIHTIYPDRFLISNAYASKIF